MTSIATAMRNAIDAKLRADAGVVAAFDPSGVRLYPLVAPTNPTFPYVIYRCEIIGDDTECAPGAEVALTLDVYARQNTYAASVAKAEAIADAVRKAMTARLTLVGHQIDDWIFDADRPLSDPDLLTEHRVVQLTYMTSATA